MILATAVMKKDPCLVCQECYSSFGVEFAPNRSSRVNSCHNNCGLLKMRSSLSQLGQFSLEFAPLYCADLEIG